MTRHQKMKENAEKIIAQEGMGMRPACKDIECYAPIGKPICPCAVKGGGCLAYRNDCSPAEIARQWLATESAKSKSNKGQRSKDY